jgi:PAS domain-containing protein
MTIAPQSSSAIDPVLCDALDVLCEGIAVFDGDGRAVVWNARYARTWASWGVTMTPGILFSDLLRAGVAAGRYSDVMGDLDVWVAEMLDRRMNGEAFDDLRCEFGEYLRFHTRPTPSGGFVITCLDVTDLKQREAKALAAQSFLDTVVENVPAMFVVKDGDTGRFLLVNRFAEQALGAPRSALLGKTDRDLFPQDQAEYFMD